MRHFWPSKQSGMPSWLWEFSRSGSNFNGILPDMVADWNCAITNHFGSRVSVGIKLFSLSSYSHDVKLLLVMQNCFICNRLKYTLELVFNQVTLCMLTSLPLTRFWNISRAISGLLMIYYLMIKHMVLKELTKTFLPSRRYCTTLVPAK